MSTTFNLSLNPQTTGNYGIKKIAFFLKTEIKSVDGVSDKDITVALSSMRDPNRSRLPFRTQGIKVEPMPLTPLSDESGHDRVNRWLEYDLTSILLNEFSDRSKNSEAMFKIGSHFKILSSFITLEFEEKHVSISTDDEYLYPCSVLITRDLVMLKWVQMYQMC